MDSQGLNFSELSKQTGISRQALTSLANNQSTGVQFSTLDVLLDYFQIDFDGFFYKPENTIAITLDIPEENFYDGELYSFSGDFSYGLHVSDENNSGLVIYSVTVLYNEDGFLSGIIMHQEDSLSEKGVDTLSLLDSKLKKISSIRIEHFFIDILESFANRKSFKFNDTVLFSYEVIRSNIVMEIEMMDGSEFGQQFYPKYSKLKVPYPFDVDNTIVINK